MTLKSRSQLKSLIITISLIFTMDFVLTEAYRNYEISLHVAMQKRDKINNRLRQFMQKRNRNFFAAYNFVSLTGTKIKIFVSFFRFRWFFVFVPLFNRSFSSPPTSSPSTVSRPKSAAATTTTATAAAKASLQNEFQYVAIGGIGASFSRLSLSGYFHARGHRDEAPIERGQSCCRLHYKIRKFQQTKARDWTGKKEKKLFWLLYKQFSPQNNFLFLCAYIWLLLLCFRVLKNTWERKLPPGKWWMIEYTHVHHGCQTFWSS